MNNSGSDQKETQNTSSATDNIESTNYVPDYASQDTVIASGNIRGTPFEDSLEILNKPKFNQRILITAASLVIVIGLSGYYISGALTSQKSSPTPTASSQLSKNGTTTASGSNSAPSSSSSSTPTSTPIPASGDISPPANAFIITNYGASTSSSNNDSAIQTAINDAGAVGGVVYVPSGAFKVDGSLHISSKITLEGQNRDNSQFVETGSAVDLLNDSADDTVIDNITLNTQTYNGGHDFGTSANNTLLEHSNIYSGSQPGHFSMFYAGPSGSPAPSPSAPRYSTGNQLYDIVESDEICDDGISWSFQKDGSITDVSQTGSRLALYVDYGNTITNFTFHPGVQATNCPYDTQGFWITPPSQNITINNFLTYGNGGKLSSESAHYSSNININNERFANASGFKMSIGDVNGLTINNSNFGSGNTINFDPTVASQNVLIENTSLANITYNSLSKLNLSCISVSPVSCP